MNPDYQCDACGHTQARYTRACPACSTDGGVKQVLPAPPPIPLRPTLAMPTACPRCGSTWITAPPTSGQQLAHAAATGALAGLLHAGVLYVPHDGAWHCDYCRFRWSVADEARRERHAAKKRRHEEHRQRSGDWWSGWLG